jgi:FAD/FMN-containing dehydrogenase
MPNSYGTFGYALRLRIELEPVSPYVSLRHVRCGSIGEAATVLEQACADGDFVDGTWFSPDEVYVTVGRWAETADAVSDYTGQDIYYRSIQARETDVLTVRDYLWRWDTDWFWCSRAFGVQHPLVRRLWPRRHRRSDVYRRIVALDRRYGFSGRLAAWRGRPPEEPVVQDVEIPAANLPAFLDAFHRDVGITPIWLCPLRLRSPEPWTLYPMRPGELYVNVGFWSSVPQRPGEPDAHNRRVERLVAELDGHKSLYSTVHYTEDEFWRHHDRPAYRALKQRYDPRGRLPDLYDKVAGKAGG